jgi:hypothetical protein
VIVEKHVEGKRRKPLMQRAVHRMIIGQIVRS